MFMLNFIYSIKIITQYKYTRKFIIYYLPDFYLLASTNDVENSNRFIPRRSSQDTDVFDLKMLIELF
jgi:hypothetical protein